MAGQMSLDNVIDYCAAHNIDGVDLTGYYFPGYPKVPTDEYIYNLKKKAYLNGVSISGTGVRNDFTLIDPGGPQGEHQPGKGLGAGRAKVGRVLHPRVLGKIHTEGFHLREGPRMDDSGVSGECAEYGKKHGVIIGLQHHDDFLKTADQTIQVMKAVNSDWFSVILDVGSLRQGDPYRGDRKAPALRVHLADQGSSVL